MQETLAQINRITNTFAPDFPFNYSFVDEEIGTYLKGEARFGKLFFAFSIIAILISLLGVFGMVFFINEKRIKEIGIRKVNGASAAEILELVNSELLRCITIAFILSTPLVYLFITSWLEHFATKTEISWWIFLIAGLITLLLSFLTVSWQSWKAATRNPVEALRYE